MLPNIKKSGDVAFVVGHFEKIFSKCYVERYDPN